MVKGPTVEWLINNHKLADYDYKSVVLADESKLKNQVQATLQNNQWIKRYLKQYTAIL